MTDESQSQESRKQWDDASATFDDAPDHGLRDPNVRIAWIKLLRSLVLAEKSLKALDLGCGTGSLSLILAEFGHTVTGIDFSPAMIALAGEKARTAGQHITFKTMDAAFPQFESRQFDLVLCRHVLWALPEPDQVLERWVNLLKPNGQLVLIEGYWHTDAGLHASNIVDMMPASMTNIVVQNLSDQPVLWGGTVTDERYVIHATKST